MFYSNQILARKGPLGLVWIAAHMEGRLKRQQINNTSIPASVDTLLDPEVPLALRLSGQLLLGVVRIYARKVAYLQQDCDAALVKIRVALRPADNCNLPPDSQVAPVEAITMLDPAQAAAVAERARKARAAKGAGGDGKNNAAAGNAAIVDGWLGPVDEDGMMLGLDDIAWDQEVLLGDSSQPGFGLGGFKFEPNRLSFGLTPSKSGLGSQDVSAVFGMYSSQDEMETFDVEDEEAAAVWDLDELEVERLRAAPSQSQRESLGGLSGLMGEDTPAGGKATATAAVSLDLGHDGFTPGSLGPQEGAQPGSPGPDGNTLDSMDLDIDPAGALPPTPQAGGEEAASAGGDDGALQHDPYDLDDMGNLCDMLPPTPAAADGDEAATAAAAAGEGATEGDIAEPAAAAAMGAEEQQQPAAEQAAGSTPTKTFQRRNTRQTVQEGPEGGADAAQPAEGAEGGGGADPVTAAKAARRRRVSGLLGLKRRVMIDSADDDAAGARPAGTRHAPTELPAAEIRALLADRAPLMDMERVHKVSKQLQQQAASSLSAQGAAALAQKQLLAITSAAAGAQGATAGRLQGAAAGAGPACGFAPGMPAVPGLGLSLGASFAGGLGLPVELQQLFSHAAAAAAAAAPAHGDGGAPAAGLDAAAEGGAGAVAPTAPLEEIGGLGEDGEDLQGFTPGAGAGASHPAGAGRCSLSLSLAGTPGSAAAVAGSMQPTPGTDAGTAGPAAAAGYTPGYTPGLAAGGEDGYTPGTAGFGPGADDVLQPLDDVNLGGDDVNLAHEGDGMFEEHGAWVGQADGGEEEKENTPGSLTGAAGKGAGSGRMVWPADAETLLEQEAAEREVPDGSFTSRTRLVVHHLRRAATAAANSAGGTGGSNAGMTPTVGSKRRISAAAVGGLVGIPLGSTGKELEGQQGGTAGPVLSFESITQGHSRLDACRWFYEVLVLSNKGLVKLQQDESYGDISVTPDVGAMARV